MRRTIAVFAATLVLGVQTLLTALPASGGVPASGCAREMACCALRGACAASEAAACASHAGSVAGPTDAAEPGASCLRSLGCGHSIPGVVVPSLDPLVLQPRVPFVITPGTAPLAFAAPAVHNLLHPEPLAPPPRA